MNKERNKDIVQIIEKLKPLGYSQAEIEYGINKLNFNQNQEVAEEDIIASIIKNIDSSNLNKEDKNKSHEINKESKTYKYYLNLFNEKEYSIDEIKKLAINKLMEKENDIFRNKEIIYLLQNHKQEVSFEDKVNENSTQNTYIYSIGNRKMFVNIPIQLFEKKYLSIQSKDNLKIDNSSLENNSSDNNARVFDFLDDKSTNNDAYKNANVDDVISILNDKTNKNVINEKDKDIENE